MLNLIKNINQSSLPKNEKAIALLTFCVIIQNKLNKPSQSDVIKFAEINGFGELLEFISNPSSAVAFNQAASLILEQIDNKEDFSFLDFCDRADARNYTEFTNLFVNVSNKKRLFN